MYARNIATFLKNMVKDGQIVLDPEDEIIRERWWREEARWCIRRVRNCWQHGTRMSIEVELSIYVFICCFLGLELVQRVSRRCSTRP